MTDTKLFTTTNKVGSAVNYVPGTTTISSQKVGGVCLTMVLTWIKESLRYEAAGKDIAKTENDITGSSLNQIAILHRSLKSRMDSARKHNLAEDVIDEIKADYLDAFGLQEIDTALSPEGNMSELPMQLLLLEKGYQLMVIASTDNVNEHAFGFKVDSGGGNCYFLDPNAGLWKYDQGDHELFTKTTFYIQQNYSAPGKTYDGGSFATTKLASH